ncbi:MULTISPECIES: methyltransferase [unclassified Nesterenkonia]|uniref:RraA family protein n=1 Tax=unclassified Nesterenkonia TaxID=2629769 RepID=UPI000871C910|nr:MULTISPECIES: methyltransferase [unclassified Nesterenkonia]MDS2172437.1 methyltransferase [Nesterenkonia sp. CL21]OSM44508.1 methyltransferase [Nesterenkonia sp. PF2B19]
MYISVPDTSSVTVDLPEHAASPAPADRLRGVPAAHVGDVFQRMLVLDGEIRSLTSSTDTVVGRALTVHTRAGDNLAIHMALDVARPGDILVINGQGDISRAVIGDLIGEIMLATGVIGAVVDGAVRDAAALGEQGLHIYARATTPAGPFKHGPGAVGRPVAVGGVSIATGDIIVADADGVAVIPADQVDHALERLPQIHAAEERIREAVRLDATATLASTAGPTPLDRQ